MSSDVLMNQLNGKANNIIQCVKRTTSTSDPKIKADLWNAISDFDESMKLTVDVLRRQSLKVEDIERIVQKQVNGMLTRKRERLGKLVEENSKILIERIKEIESRVNIFSNSANLLLAERSQGYKSDILDFKKKLKDQEMDKRHFYKLQISKKEEEISKLSEEHELRKKNLVTKVEADNSKQFQELAQLKALLLQQNSEEEENQEKLKKAHQSDIKLAKSRKEGVFLDITSHFLSLYDQIEAEIQRNIDFIHNTKECDHHLQSRLRHIEVLYQIEENKLSYEHRKNRKLFDLIKVKCDPQTYLSHYLNDESEETFQATEETSPFDADQQMKAIKIDISAIEDQNRIIELIADETAQSQRIMEHSIYRDAMKRSFNAIIEEKTSNLISRYALLHSKIDIHFFDILISANGFIADILNSNPSYEASIQVSRLKGFIDQSFSSYIDFRAKLDEEIRIKCQLSSLELTLSAFYHIQSPIRIHQESALTAWIFDTVSKIKAMTEEIKTSEQSKCSSCVFYDTIIRALSEISQQKSQDTSEGFKAPLPPLKEAP